MADNSELRDDSRGSRTGVAPFISNPSIQERLREVALAMYSDLSSCVTGPEPVEADLTWLPTCVQRLQACCEYHWERVQPSTDFEGLIDRLMHGQLSRATLQANLLYDVTLSAGLEAHDANAAVVFELNYMPLVRAIASRVGGERAVTEVENFVAELILPRGDKGARISKYSGKTSLACWLRAVVYNFSVSRLREVRWQALDEGHSLGENFDESTDAKEVSECENLLRPLFARAVAALDDEGQYLLKSLILDGVSQTELAKLLGVHKGTLTRRRQAAEKTLWEKLAAELAASPTKTRARECLDETLAGNEDNLRLEIATLLAETIRDADIDMGREDGQHA